MRLVNQKNLNYQCNFSLFQTELIKIALQMKFFLFYCEVSITVFYMAFSVRF